MSEATTLNDEVPYRSAHYAPSHVLFCVCNLGPFYEQTLNLRFMRSPLQYFVSTAFSAFFSCHSLRRLRTFHRLVGVLAGCAARRRFRLCSVAFCCMSTPHFAVYAKHSAFGGQLSGHFFRASKQFGDDLLVRGHCFQVNLSVVTL